MSVSVLESREWYCDRRGCGATARTDSVAGGWVRMPDQWVAIGDGATARHFCSEAHGREQWADNLRLRREL